MIFGIQIALNSFDMKNELCELLSVDAEETIRFLDSCSEEEANTASSVFEEVAANLQSWEYIKCLRRLDKKYPKSLLGCLVDIAENNMNTGKQVKHIV